MIKIKSLEKIYYSKEGKECKALSGINLDLPDRGMIFVLGKSGSGKSTLLNLLGGLDRPTSGKIIYKGNSFKNFKDKDYDAYRNNLGFVFQDSNLIETLTVRENLAIALELKTGKAEEKEILNALSKAEMSDYINRYPYELSGGQKQRVSLARALVKNPDIILADEPTGNLDLKTGKIVLDKLKELSSDHLVIVVSHDRLFAESYADRIIELKDGKIIKDTSEYIDNSAHNYSLSRGKRLKFIHCLKLTGASFRFRPFRLITIIILTAIIVSLLAVSQAIRDYDINESHARNLIDEKYDYLSLSYLQEPINYDIDYSEFNYYADSSANLSASFIERISQKYPSINYIEALHMRENKYIVYQDDIFGLELMDGSEALISDSVYMTDIMAYDFINNNELMGRFSYYYIKNGEEYTLINKDMEISALIGKNIYIKTPISFEEFTYEPMIKVAGILKTGSLQDYIDYYSLPEKARPVNADSSELLYKLNNIFLFYYISTEYFNLHQHQPDNINWNHNLSIAVNSGDMRSEESYLSVYNNDTLNSIGNFIVTSNGVYQGMFDRETIEDKSTYHLKEDLIVNSGEIILSVDQYNLLFNENYDWTIDYMAAIMWDDVLLFDPEIPSHLGEKISISIYDDSGNLIADIEDLTLKGIISPFNEETNGSLGNGNDLSVLEKNGEHLLGVYLTDEVKNSFFSEMPPFISELTISVPKNFAQLKELLDYTQNKNVYPSSSIAEAVYRYTIRSLINVTLIVALSIVFLSFVIALLFNYISSGIKSRTKEIGILSSQGASLLDIFKIYMLESVFIALGIIVMAGVFIPISLTVVNKIIEQYILEGINAYVLSSISYLYLFILPPMVVLFSSLIPILLIKKLKPIDAIKNRS
jgi:ABC-type lipoprotein export system ATPase subunit